MVAMALCKTSRGSVAHLTRDGVSVAPSIVSISFTVIFNLYKLHTLYVLCQHRSARLTDGTAFPIEAYRFNDF